MTPRDHQLLVEAYEAFNAREVERALATLRPGRIVVDVHQIVRDLSGSVKADQVVPHVYRLRDGRIAAMEIRTPTTA